MKANVGGIDRLLRVIIGLGILGAGYYNKNWWGLVGVIPLLIAFIRWCPVYLPFGTNTCEKKPTYPQPSKPPLL